MSMSPGKVISVGALFLGALAADYVRIKLVGSYDFPEDSNSETVAEDKEQDNTDDN